VTREIRFGVVSESVLDGPAWADHARRVEEAGIGSLRLHRQRGPDPRGPPGPARAVRPVLPGHPGPRAAHPRRDHGRLL